MCRVVISGFYGFDNAGDEAILKSMVSEFRKVYSDIDIVVLSATPAKTAASYHVKSVNRSNFLQVFSAIKNCDLLISGGGGLFQDVTSNYSMWYYSGIVLIAFLLRKPVFAFAQGIGPIRNPFNRRLLRFVMDRVRRISVRDQWSYKELQSIGIKKDVLCTVDPAFLIELPSKEKSVGILNQESKGAISSRPKVGFSIRSWKGSIDISGVFAEVADRVSRELGVDVVFFPLHHAKDMGLAEEIASKMKEKSIIIRQQYAPEELIGLYGIMDMNVCIRLHGLVFSLMNGVPMVAISYDPKIDSFMDSLEMKSILTYDKLNPEEVFGAIKENWENRQNVSQQIESKRNHFKELAKKGILEITQSLKKIEKFKQ